MKISPETYRDKVYGCWAGKCLGGAIGMPFEGVPFQPDLRREDINIQDVPNDDLELQLVWLLALEKYGLELDTDKLAKIWVEDIRHGCDEYSMAIRNIQRGIMPPASGWDNNLFADGMGATIRSEIWAAVFPGRPDAAGYFATCDAVVDHWGEGVWSEVFLAKAESRLFAGDELISALKSSLAEVPSETRLRKALTFIFDLYENGCELEEARLIIIRKFYHHNFTDCVMNLSFILFALLWGEGDFVKTILLAINCGRDTDCTAATCGAIMGICRGSSVIPAFLLDSLSPDICLGEFVGQIKGIVRTLPELVDRTVAVKEQVEKVLPATLYPDYQPLEPGEPSTFDSGRWLVLDRTKHDTEAIKEELLRTGKCPEALSGNILTTIGLDLDLTPYADCANSLDLFTFLDVENEDVEPGDVTISATADVGMTMWFDRDRLFNHHSRMLALPSFHRPEGGIAFNYPLRHGDRKLVHIRLYSCLPPLRCILMFGNNLNDHLEGFKLSI